MMQYTKFPPTNKFQFECLSDPLNIICLHKNNKSFPQVISLRKILKYWVGAGGFMRSFMVLMARISPYITQQHLLQEVVNFKYNSAAWIIKIYFSSGPLWRAKWSFYRSFILCVLEDDAKRRVQKIRATVF